MKLILTMNYHDPQRLGVPVPDRTFARIRYAVRAVITDEAGGVYLMHAATHGYYKLPGGGIDPGEGRHEALAREVREEMGAQVEVLSELGRTVQFDEEADFCQHSYCYLTRLTGQLGPSQLTTQEAEAGFRVQRFGSIAAAVSTMTTDGHNPKYDFMTVRDAAVLRVAIAAQKRP